VARTGNVEVGVCAKSADLENAVHYGFDYLEPSVAEISEMDETKFAAFKARVLASPIRCKSFNSFIRTLRVVGDDVEQGALRDYLESSLERCRQLGGSVVVWGSAGSRNVPAGYSRDAAWEQMKDFLRQAGEVAKSKGIVIAIEPLRKKESNIINTGAEALRLVRETGHPNVKMIIDYYHLREENEDPQIVWEARGEIVHLHFANPNGRLWPKDIGEDPLYGRFFELVKRIHFRGGISIEGRGTFASDAAASMEFFRRELA
jgi:sugar phosphate isomerase/epimerase